MKTIDQVVSTSTYHGNSELNRIEYLDGWRGLAILCVLIGHFTAITHNGFFFIGRFGVDVFFVLSGLLMSKILFIKRVPLTIFYKRRISRILPVFFIFVLVLYSIDFLFSYSQEHENVLYTFLFLRSYLPLGTNIWAAPLPIDHLWSLNIEEHCYIVLSLLTLIGFLKKRVYIAVISLGVLSVLIHYFYVKYPALSPVNIHARSEVSAAPLLLSAGYFLIHQKFSAFVKSWMPIAALVIAAIGYTKFTYHWAASWLFTPFLLAFAVNHLDKAPKFFLQLLAFKPLQLLGLWSYSIYLWQQPFYRYLEAYKHDILMFYLLGTLFMALTTLIGYLSFKYIENPIRTYMNNRW